MRLGQCIARIDTKDSTPSEIHNLILEKDYTNYFNIQTAINEMESSGLISGETIRNSSFFLITSEGRETLRFFNKEIPGKNS